MGLIIAWLLFGVVINNVACAAVQGHLRVYDAIMSVIFCGFWPIVVVVSTIMFFYEKIAKSGLTLESILWEKK